MKDQHVPHINHNCIRQERILAHLFSQSAEGKTPVIKCNAQGRIQTGSKGSHKPVKQFIFLKQSFKIYYQIPDYKKFRVSHVKLRESLKKLNDIAPCIFAAPTEHNTVRPIHFTSWLEDAPELST